MMMMMMIMTIIIMMIIIIIINWASYRESTKYRNYKKVVIFGTAHILRKVLM